MENRPTEHIRKPLVGGLSLVFASFYSLGFSASNIDYTSIVKTHTQWVSHYKEVTRRLGETAETHLSRKTRKKTWPNKGEPPPTLGNKLPACRAACPGSPVWPLWVQTAHWPIVCPRPHCGQWEADGPAPCPAHTALPLTHLGCRACLELPVRQSAFHFIGREKPQRKKGGRS